MVIASAQAETTGAPDTCDLIDSEMETRLRAEIDSLWSAQKNSKAAVRRNREELKTLRRDLGEKLQTMKSLLVRTGRSGRWAAYLRSHKLPRATADRYVREHEATLLPQSNRLTEAVSEPSEDDISQFVQKLLPRLRRVLTTNEAVYHFFDELILHLPPVDGGHIAGPEEAIRLTQALHSSRRYTEGLAQPAFAAL
jgi:hypothetical protein